MEKKENVPKNVREYLHSRTITVLTLTLMLGFNLFSLGSLNGLISKHLESANRNKVMKSLG